MNRIFLVLLCCVLVSCHTSKKVVYMQDATDRAIEQIIANQGIAIQPKDILSIVVSSKNPELVQGLNLPMLTFQAGSSTTSSYMYRLLGYLVDMEGNIDFPILGKLKVTGMTREQVSDMIKKKLIQENLIKDPIVNTELMNFKISILGEVRSPGTFELSDDRISILEALSRAGDLTIYGKRDNVLVRREKEGKVSFYRVDLRSTELLHSPVYYLQQNDVVYVQPNNTVAVRSRINENRTLGVWISLTSLFTSLAILFVK